MLAALFAAFGFLGCSQETQGFKDEIKMLKEENAPGGTYEDLHKVKGLPLAVHFFDIRNGVTRETANDGTDRVLPGEGQIDLVKFLRNLKEDGFDGDVWPEIFGLKELREGDSWEVPKRVRDACRSVMDQV